MGWIIVLYAGFASVFTFSKLALGVSEPFFLIGSRMFLAGALLLGYLAITDRKALKLSRNALKLAFALGALNIYLTNAFEFWGLKYLTSFKTCFIYSLSPFASALLSYFLFSERMTNKKWLGLLIGFSGFIPLFISHSDEELKAGTLFNLSWAEISVAMAALTSVYGWILLKQLVSEEKVPFLAANGYSMAIGGFIALIHSFATETWAPIPVSDYSIFLFGFVALLLISNFLCYNLYGWLLKSFSATFLSFSGFLTPIFSAFFGWYFLGETIDLPFYLSAAIVFSGLMIFYQEEIALVPLPKK